MKKLLLSFLSLFVLVACQTDKDHKSTIKVAATSLPHAEILQAVRPLVQEKGYNLEITVIDDYTIPNKLLNDGEIDANYFQHTPYLDDFNQTANTNLKPVLLIHYEPISIYAGKSDSLDQIKKGASILVPDDATNLPRALLLLEELSLITLNNEGKTLNDITDNPYELEIIEMKSDSIAAMMVDADYAILNGNYALAANVLDRHLASETIDDQRISEIANVLAVREEDVESEKTSILIESLKNPKIHQFIEENFSPTVISILN